MSNYKYDIFISYSRSDSDYAKQIANRLSNLGLRVWFDSWELLVGQSWRDSISDAIRDSRNYIVLIGKDYDLNSSTKAELGLILSIAEERDTDQKIIPALLPSSTPDLIPEELKVFVYLDLRDGFSRLEQLQSLALSASRKDISEELKKVEELVTAGNYDEAITLITNLIEETKDRGETPELVNLYNALGILKRDLGLFDEAFREYETALRLSERFDDQPSMSVILNNMGSLCITMGNYSDAESLINKALEIDQEVFGSDHPVYSSHLSNLATVFQETERYEEALELFQKVREIDRYTLGENHPNEATNLSNMGLVYSSLGELSLAKDLLERALEIDLSNYGENHTIILTRLSNLAYVTINLGQFDEGIGLQERALNISMSILGEQHPQHATLLNNLAIMYFNRGDRDKAISSLEKSIDLYKATVGEDHPNLRNAERNLKDIQEIKSR